MINVKQITVGLTKKVQLRDFEPAEPFVELVADVEGLDPAEAEEAAKLMMASVTRVVQEGFAVPPERGGKPVLVVDNTTVAETEAARGAATPAVADDDMGLPPADPGPRQDLDTYVTEPQIDHAAAKVELSDLQEAAAKAAAKIKPAEVKKLIAVYAKSLAEVPEDKYEELLAVLKGVT